MIDANRLYKIAYDAHYKMKNSPVAYSLYNELINHYPDSEEKQYAVTQIHNIESNIGDAFDISSISDAEKEQVQRILRGESICVEYGKNVSEEAVKSLALHRTNETLRKNMMLTTGNSFDGYKVIKYIDAIFEEMVIGIGLKTSVRAIGDMLSTLTGDEYTAITERLKAVKKILRERVIDNAADIGANALLGIDFESSMGSSNSLMVSMSATAVFIVKFTESQSSSSK